MSISPHLRDVNDRFSALERCAEMAPEGTFERAKQAAGAVGDASNAVMKALQEQGFITLNDDSLRNVEAAIYQYLLQGNPLDAGEIAVSEGFGRAVDGPAGARVVEQAESDRDALRAMRPR